MRTPRPNALLRKMPGAGREYLGMLLVLALLVAVFGILARHFFSPLTFRMTVNQIPGKIILAVGMTYVLIIAGIDLSVGSVLALSGGTVGMLIEGFGVPVPLAVTAGLGVGLVCGLINGAISVAWRLPSFIVTLGMLEIARGATYLVTSRETKYIRGSGIEAIADTQLLGISLPFLVAIAIAVAAQVVLSRTVFGRYMIAIGTNEEAVRLSGINPRPIKLTVFTVCGLLASVAAVMDVSRTGSADPNAGTGFELQAIAAVVIGGTSLMGGRGSVIRSLFGVLIIAVLGAGLSQIGATEAIKRIITGCVIVAAVILDYYRQRLRRAPQ